MSSNICKTRSDVGAMFHFFPSYAYLHKSKKAAVDHIEFLTFDRIALKSHVISFLTNLNALIPLVLLFL